MAKKKKNLALPILLGVLVVLGGSYGAIKAYNASEAAKKTDESEAEEAKKVFGDLKAEDIEALSYVASEETLSFVKDGDTWYLKEDRELPVNQTKFSSMTSALANLEEKKLVEESLDNLSAYGLETPSNVISFQTSGGEEYTLYVGDKNAITNECYFYLKGENRVCTAGTTLADNFQTILSAYYTVPTLPEMVKSDLMDIEISNPNGFLAVRNLPDGDPLVDYMGGNTWFVEDENGSRSVLDMNEETTLTDRVTGLGLESCVDYKPSQEALETYGLADPAAALKIRYMKTAEEPASEGGGEATGSDAAEAVKEEALLEILIGAKEEGGRYYVKIKDADQVCLMSAANAEYFLNLNQTMLTNLNACMINIESVDRLTLEADGVKMELSISREEKKNEDSDTTTRVDTYFINGVETDESNFKSVYQTVIGLKGEKALDSQEALETGTQNTAKPEVAMTFYRNTEQLKEVRFELTPYDSSFYQLSINGTPSLLVNKFDVSKIKELVNAEAQK